LKIKKKKEKKQVRTYTLRLISGKPFEFCKRAKKARRGTLVTGEENLVVREIKNWGGGRRGGGIEVFDQRGVVRS